LIYGERLVLSSTLHFVLRLSVEGRAQTEGSEVEGLVLKARPEGSRTMVMRMPRMFMGDQI